MQNKNTIPAVLCGVILIAFPVIIYWLSLPERTQFDEQAQGRGTQDAALPRRVFGRLFSENILHILLRSLSAPRARIHAFFNVFPRTQSLFMALFAFHDAHINPI